MLGSWQGTLAVYMPQPVYEPSSLVLPPCKQPCRGHWLISNTTTTLRAHLELQQQTFTLQLTLQLKAPSNASLCVDIDLFQSGCEAQLLLPDTTSNSTGASAVLLIALGEDSQTAQCKFGVRQGAQVLAFKFISLLDAQALKDMFKRARDPSASISPAAAQHPAQCPSQTQQILDATQPLMNMDDEQLQGLLEGYLAEPGFLEYVDRLEHVWDRMTQAAPGQAQRQETAGD